MHFPQKKEIKNNKEENVFFEDEETSPRLPKILFEKSRCRIFSSQSVQYQFVLFASQNDLKNLKNLSSQHSAEINIDAFVTDKHSNQYSALSAAVLNGHMETVQFLLSKKATITQYALKYAMETGNTPILSLFTMQADKEVLRQLFLLTQTGSMEFDNNLTTAFKEKPEITTQIIISLQAGMLEKITPEYQKGLAFFKKLQLSNKEIREIFQKKIEQLYGILLEETHAPLNSLIQE